MLYRMAGYGRKLISPVSTFLVGISMAAMAAAVLLIVVDVCMRSFFNSPIRGASDLVILAFTMIAFYPMALAALEGEHVALDILGRRFPRLPRLITEAVVLFVTAGMLGVVSWRLAMQGIRLQEMNGETVLLGIPFSPFLYAATFGFVLMTLIFFLKALESLGKIRRQD